MANSPSVGDLTKRSHGGLRRVKSRAQEPFALGQPQFLFDIFEGFVRAVSVLAPFCQELDQALVLACPLDLFAKIGVITDLKAFPIVN